MRVYAWGSRHSPDRVGCRNLQGLRASFCPRGGETAVDGFSVGDNLPVPVINRTFAGDPIRKRVFLSHDAPLQKTGGSATGLSATGACVRPLPVMAVNVATTANVPGGKFALIKALG
jgi:hypothetical protein